MITKKSTKKRFYKGVCFHYNKSTGCYKIFHLDGKSYLILDFKSIDETKEAINKILKNWVAKYVKGNRK